MGSNHSFSKVNLIKFDGIIVYPAFFFFFLKKKPQFFFFVKFRIISMVEFVNYLCCYLFTNVYFHKSMFSCHLFSSLHHSIFDLISWFRLLRFFSCLLFDFLRGVFFATFSFFVLLSLIYFPNIIFQISLYN